PGNVDRLPLNKEIRVSYVFERKGPKQEERRYFPRWKVDKEVLYQLRHETLEKEARALDMSCNGACILSNEPLLPTQRIILSIFLNKAKVVTVNGRVAWIKHFPKQNEAGICFDAIDEATQNTIMDHFFHAQKKDV